MRFLIRDRGGQFTISFDAVFESYGLRTPRSPLRAPRANAICERLVGMSRCELLGHVLILNERHPCVVLVEFVAHYNYNAAHPLEGIAQRVPDADAGQPPRRSSTLRPEAAY